MDRPDDPEKRKRKTERLKPAEIKTSDAKLKKPVEVKIKTIKTTDAKLNKLRKIFQDDKARSIAHDPKLHEKWERARAKGTPKVDKTGYKEYGRIRSNVAKRHEFKDKEVHHVEFPRKKHVKLSTDTHNLLLTDKETHKDLHRLTGGKGLDMYRKKTFANQASAKGRASVRDYFNFQNPKSTVRLEEVKKKLELKRRLQAVPMPKPKKTRG